MTSYQFYLFKGCKIITKGKKIKVFNIKNQLDMIYKDQVNGTTTWKDKITEIKNKYPKE